MHMHCILHPTTPTKPIRVLARDSLERFPYCLPLLREFAAQTRWVKMKHIYRVTHSTMFTHLSRHPRLTLHKLSRMPCPNQHATHRSVRFQLQFKGLWSKVVSSCLPTDRELLRCLWMLALVLCRGRQQHQDLLSAEATVSAFTHRTRRVFEECLSNQHAHGNQMVLAWRLFVSFELSPVCRNYATAKKLFGRALQRCPWSKELWLDCVRQMRGTMSKGEMNNWIDVALQKKIALRSIPDLDLKPENSKHTD